MTEVAPRWRTSTRSDDAGNCVEVADNLPDVVLIRDSKDRNGPTLTFRPDAWRSFVNHQGRLSHPGGEAAVKGGP